MRAKLARLAQNLTLSLASLAVCLVVLEFVVFRMLLVPDDVLENVSINNVVRYAPGSVATFRHPDGGASTVTVNDEGWNSTRRHYARGREAGVRRIAVVGDSYVHAAMVDPAEAFPEVLEGELRRAGVPVEVLRFGMDGAPLSQYLHMMRREVLAFRPDIVLVPLIHNDFDESWRFLKSRYASSFLKIAWDETGEPFEIPPAEFDGGSVDLLRGSAMFRYLYYETNAYLHLKRLVSRYVWGGDEDWRPESISSAVDIRKIAEHGKNRAAARHVLGEMKALSERHGFRLVLVMDGVREAVYSGKPRETYAVARLNEMVGELARELELPFLDLQETFAAVFARTGQRFEFAFDWHWNRDANRLVGEMLARWLGGDHRLAPTLGVRLPGGVPPRT